MHRQICGAVDVDKASRRFTAALKRFGHRPLSRRVKVNQFIPRLDRADGFDIQISCVNSYVRVTAVIYKPKELGSDQHMLGSAVLYAVPRGIGEKPGDSETSDYLAGLKSDGRV